MLGSDPPSSAGYKVKHGIMQIKYEKDWIAIQGNNENIHMNKFKFIKLLKLHRKSVKFLPV